MVSAGEVTGESIDTQAARNSGAVWILVPARGGSKGIPRKNVRILGTQPLILHCLTELGGAGAPGRLIVSTDCAEIQAICEPHALIHLRSAHLANDHATLDEVAVEAAQWLLQQGATADDILLTVQPTSPFVRRGTVLRAIEHLEEGAGSVLTVKDDRHLQWTLNDGRPAPLYRHRVNRQQLPPTFRETGGIIGTRIGTLLQSGTRINDPIALLPVDEREGLDIDSYADWAVAEFFARRMRIIIRADASPQLGTGHIYRALALAHELADHDICLVTRGDGPYRLGADFLASQSYPVTLLADDAEFFPLLGRFAPHVVILDVLDNELEFIARIKDQQPFVVSLEDLGPGARLADLVINDLYTDLYPDQTHWYGVQHAILSPQFDNIEPSPQVPHKVEKVLVTFGGTDQQNLTVKALAALQEVGFGGEVQVVCGLGYIHPPVDLGVYGLHGEVHKAVGNMAVLMQSADVAITSAGRTVTELMVCGVPTIVLCQNLRELRHTHASGPYGIINLGLGQHVSVSGLAEHVGLLLTDRALREGMRERQLQAVRGRSNRSICGRIVQAATDYLNIRMDVRASGMSSSDRLVRSRG